ncbi:MAG: hypothetical protein OSA51_06070 [Octadecabacter sp.]|nr:hypothetical protein [Octadecabacter sp.]
MPQILINDHLHCLAHFPKDAGVSVNQYLIRQFGFHGFKGSTFVQTHKYLRYSRIAPQHILLHALEKFMPQRNLANFFTMVHCLRTRLIPIFKIRQRIQLKKIHLILHGLLANQLEEFPKKMFANFSDFLPQKTLLSCVERVLKLEDGFGKIVTHVATLASRDASILSNQHIQHRSNKNSDVEIKIFKRRHIAVKQFHPKDCERQSVQQKIKWFQKSQYVLPSMQHENSTSV